MGERCGGWVRGRSSEDGEKWPRATLVSEVRLTRIVEGLDVEDE